VDNNSKPNVESIKPEPTVRAKSVAEMAREELKAELMKESKEKLKSKMRELHRAQQMLDNIKRELQDLEEQLTDKIDAI
jgi:hypothetical protein